MIRACRIARGRPDAFIFLFYQLFIGKGFILFITPIFFSDFLVQAFSKGFYKTIGQYLNQDLIILIMISRKPVYMFPGAMNGYCK